MRWSAEDVSEARAVTAVDGREIEDLDEVTIRSILDLATKLIAARGGTLSAESLDARLRSIRDPPDRLPGTSAGGLRGHMLAQGARIVAMESRIAELEGLAARGGTLTAVEFSGALAMVDEHCADRAVASIQAHATAQGARIAALEADARRCCPRDHNADGDCDRHPVGTVARLEQHNLEAKRAADEYRKRMKETLDQVGRLNQHISDLEKSLENARKELDDTIRSSAELYRHVVAERDEVRQHWKTADEERGAELSARRAAEEELGRTRSYLENARKEREIAVASLALALKIAAKLQSARDAAQAELATLLSIAGPVADDIRTIEKFCEIGAEPTASETVADRSDVSEALDRIAVKAKGYDAAVADNAALPEFCAREAFRAVQRAEWGHNLPNGMTLEQYVPHAVAEALKSRPHPGAALLERMKRLEAALNAAAATMWRVSQYGSMVIETAGELQRNVRALRPLLTATCHDGSCVVCRSGEPCH
jgi:uncharacterized membrane-anchored protein YhcB (DUF1043 family)